MRLDHLVRLIAQQWAIHPDVLENWCSILDAKLAGHAIPAVGAIHELPLQAAGGNGRSRTDDEPFIRDGNIAVVPVVGTLVKANTFFGCDLTYGEIRQAVAAAERAKGIDAIVIDGDTPGGTVAGAQETGDFLHQVNQRKPVFGWVDDLAASAGFWLLAQTRMIGAHAAADIGSIGVLTVHYDRSGRDQQAGVRRSVLAVGDYKAAGNDTAPLSDEARAYIMERLNQTYDLFINAVTRGRKVTAEQVRAMQSRVYKSAQARELGLIDHVMGRDEYFALVRKQIKNPVSIHISKGATAMDLATLRAEHPDLVAQIEAAAREGLLTAAAHEAALATARTEARSGVLALHSAVFGEETGKKFAAVVESGVTAEQAQALGVTVAASTETGDLASRARILEGLHAVAPDGLKPAETEAGKETERKAAVSSIAAGANSR